MQNSQYFKNFISHMGRELWYLSCFSGKKYACHCTVFYIRISVSQILLNIYQKTKPRSADENCNVYLHASYAHNLNFIFHRSAQHLKEALDHNRVNLPNFIYLTTFLSLPHIQQFRLYPVLQVNLERKKRIETWSSSSNIYAHDYNYNLHLIM